MTGWDTAAATALPCSVASSSPYPRGARLAFHGGARNLLAQLAARVRLAGDDERDFAAALIAFGKAGEAAQALPAWAALVIFQADTAAFGFAAPGHLRRGCPSSTMVRKPSAPSPRTPAHSLCWSVSSTTWTPCARLPENLPNRHLLEEDLGSLASSVRDPFGEWRESFGVYNNALPARLLGARGSSDAFVSATECHALGRLMRRCWACLERFAGGVQAIMLPTLGEARRATYSSFWPISSKTGRALQALTSERISAGRDRLLRRGRER